MLLLDIFRLARIYFGVSRRLRESNDRICIGQFDRRNMQENQTAGLEPELRICKQLPGNELEKIENCPLTFCGANQTLASTSKPIRIRLDAGTSNK